MTSGSSSSTSHRRTAHLDPRCGQGTPVPARAPCEPHLDGQSPSRGHRRRRPRPGCSRRARSELRNGTASNVPGTGRRPLPRTRPLGRPVWSTPAPSRRRWSRRRGGSRVRSGRDRTGDVVRRSRPTPHRVRRSTAPRRRPRPHPEESSRGRLRASRKVDSCRGTSPHGAGRQADEGAAELQGPDCNAAHHEPESMRVPRSASAELPDGVARDRGIWTRASARRGVPRPGPGCGRSHLARDRVAAVDRFGEQPAGS